MSQEKKRDWDDAGELVLEKDKTTDKPRQHKVILHNDHYTTMEFVVMVLMRFFQKSETEATHVMLTVHHKGSGVAGVYSKDVAETKVQEVTEFSQDSGMPLRLTTEPT
jgi:ATP-dependent Clp protease adaptor protein ClpS